MPEISRRAASLGTENAFVVLADGSVHLLSESMDLTTFCNLADRDDGNVVGEF